MHPGNRADTCGRTVMTKLLGAFRDNVNALKNIRIPSHRTKNLIQQ